MTEDEIFAFALAELEKDGLLKQGEAGEVQKELLRQWAKCCKHTNPNFARIRYLLDNEFMQETLQPETAQNRKEKLNMARKPKRKPKELILDLLATHYGRVKEERTFKRKYEAVVSAIEELYSMEIPKESKKASPKFSAAQECKHKTDDEVRARLMSYLALAEKRGITLDAPADDK